MIKFSRWAGLLLCASLLTACATAPQPKFYWGSYEHSLYVYSKKPDQRAAYKLALEQAVEKGRAENVMAPGMLSELGYLYLEDRDTAHAVALFQEEMTRFPESRKFMTLVIERAKANAAATPEKKDSAS